MDNINEHNLEDDYNKIITNCLNNGTLSLLEHSYITQYWKNESIVKSNWFVEIINKQNNNKLCDIINQQFSTIYEKIDEENKIISVINNLTKKLIKNKKNTIEFNSEQKKVIQKIFNFLSDNKKKTFGSYGYAGTGKTTIIVEIISFLLLKKMIKTIVFSAPTNQALYVLKNKFRPYLKKIYKLYTQKELSKNFDFDDAIEQLYNVNIKIDFLTLTQLLKFEMEYTLVGTTFLKNKAGSLMSNYEIIIIDECSMISINYAEIIFNEIRNVSKNNSDKYKKNPKIIFLGDKAQLPPVGEKTSIIFAKSKNDYSFDEYKNLIIKLELEENESFKEFKPNILEQRYKLLINDIKKIETNTLEKVMRTKSKDVSRICYQFRLWALGTIKIPDLAPYIGGDVKAYRYVTGSNKLKNEWFKICLKEHLNGKNYNMILTWTNYQADEYNREIRHKLFNKCSQIERFMVGDILLLNKFYNIDDKTISYIGENSKDKKYRTSEQIKVIEVEKILKNIPFFLVELSKNTLDLANISEYQSKLKQCIDKINSSTKRSYLCWKLTVNKNDASNENNIIYVIHENALKLYEGEKTFIQFEIKKLKNILFTKYKNKTEQINKNIIKPLINNFRKNIDEPFADVNYGYAITCNKGQGSNFDNTFIDVDDILKNVNDIESKQRLYTAVTRTKYTIHLLVKQT
jgi:hypothetical protein